MVTPNWRSHIEWLVALLAAVVMVALGFCYAALDPHSASPVLRLISAVIPNLIAALLAVVALYLAFTWRGLSPTAKREQDFANLIADRIGARSQTTFLDDMPEQFEGDLCSSTDLWLVGTHHSSTLTAYHGQLRDVLQRGGFITVLLVSPHSAAAGMAAMRFPGRVTESQESARIESSLAAFADLRQHYPKQLRIRTIDFLMDFSAFLIDPTSPRSVVYLERCTFRTSGGAKKPKFVYRPQDGQWFSHTVAEVRNLWDAADEYYNRHTMRSEMPSASLRAHDA